jgi:nicotinamidase-related amidase
MIIAVCYPMGSKKEQIYEEKGNFGNRVGYGSSPALVVIDLQRGETDPEHPLGSDLTEVVENSNDLAATARENDVPVVWTRIVYAHPEAEDGGGPAAMLLKKSKETRNWTPGSKWVEFDDRLDIEPEDYILEKRHASVFKEANLDLDSVLRGLGVDTVVIAGCSTSGCVRASAEEANALGFHPILPEECVGERSDELHERHLWEIQMRYGDVRPTEEIERYFSGEHP